MMVSQNGKCAICKDRPAEHLDHDHATGKLRGLTCFPCNGGLGQFKDNIEYLESAIEYLRDHDSSLDELREKTTTRLQQLNLPAAIETARATLAS
jgi:hypothetical protein